MFEEFIKESFRSGDHFEFAVCTTLQTFGFKAYRTGNDDRGVDIIAEAPLKDITPKFYIQCKCHNKSIGLAPIQEVYAGCHLRGNDGYPVVITNNIVTHNARVAAAQLGVEIIGEGEWRELENAYRQQKILNTCRYGLLGILMGSSTGDYEHIQRCADNLTQSKSSNHQDTVEPISNNTELSPEQQIIKQKYEEALICEQEAAELEQQASYRRQQSISLIKEAVLKNFRYG